MRSLIFTTATVLLWGVLTLPLLAQAGAAGSAESAPSGASAKSGSGQAGSGQSGQGQTANSGQPSQGQPGPAGQPDGPTATTPSKGAATANPNQGNQAGANFRAGQQQQQQNMIDANQRQMQAQQQMNNAQRDRQRMDQNRSNSDNDRSGRFGVNSRTGSQRAFRFDDRPEFRIGLQRRNFPLDDWRIVFNNGRYWFWTPHQTWVYYDNGNWVDFRPGIYIGRNEVLFPPGYPQDDWRIVTHRGRRWYYAPDNVWLYYDNGNWVIFQANVPSGAVALFPPGYPPDEWRVVVHSGRRWYWTPDGAWLLFEGNRWNPFRGDRLGQRQRVGFRGVDDQQIDGQRPMDRPQLDPPGNAKVEGDINRNQTFRDQQPGNQQQSGGTAVRQPGGATQQQGQPAGQSGNVMPPPTPPTPAGSDKSAMPSGQTGGGAEQGASQAKDK
jgi:hypothetical protein